MSDKLDYDYQEMIRLAEKADEYAKSAFDDFKLLGALGVLVAWPPLVEGLMGGTAKTVLLGFLAILVVTAFVGLFGLLRQSMANFYIEEVCAYEKSFRQVLGSEDGTTFRVAEHWLSRGRLRQRRVALRFYGLFYGVVLFYPTVVLLFYGVGAALVYLVSSAVVVAVHVNATLIVHGRGESGSSDQP